VTRLQLRRRLDDRLRERCSDLWPTVGERKQVVDRVTQGYRSDPRKRRWLVQEQADLYGGAPVYVVYRALGKTFQDPLRARAEAVKEALNSIEQGAG
jgi:hypothetical protein